MNETLPIRRLKIRLTPDSSRVLVRPFRPHTDERITKIIGRVMALSEETVIGYLRDVLREFADRHTGIEPVLLSHFEMVRRYLLTDLEPSRERKLLLGAYFTSEYALESAALFNPSLVAHPDQSGAPPGSVRFVMSLRATGEGHISSIEFRTGTIHPGQEIEFDPAGRFVTEPQIIPNPSYDKPTFRFKLHDLGFENKFSQEILEALGQTFSLSQLNEAIQSRQRNARAMLAEERRTLDRMKWLAYSNYEVQFSPEQALSERIIFPYSPSQTKGLEDARFVRFEDDDGAVQYYATYTAYDGRDFLPQLIVTRDFAHFQVVTLNGKAVQNKGMALFPRKIDGQYVMMSRQDNENLFLMFSGNIHFWHSASLLLRPTYSWEFVQLGNCGSPIETEAGWLVLTHGVGVMRRYCIGAILLDRNDPRRVLGRLKEPLLMPNENEREGYVPNVVYTCGGIVHDGQLIIPYAMSDYATSLAVVPVDAVLKGMA